MIKVKILFKFCSRNMLGFRKRGEEKFGENSMRSLIIYTLYQSRKMGQAEQIARMGERRGKYKILVVKSEGN